MKKLALVCGVLILTSCGSTGIVMTDEDHYMISIKSAKLGFVSAAEEKAEVYKQANAFCAAKGKRVETINLELRDSGAFQSASATLDFRCLTATSSLETGNTTNPPIGNDVVSGTYVSEITTNDNWFFGKAEQRSMKITLNQDGNNIIGFNQRYDLKIEGVRTGDTISFVLLASEVTSHIDVIGKWSVGQGDDRIEGTWEVTSSDHWGQGQWNLKRIE